MLASGLTTRSDSFSGVFWAASAGGADPSWSLEGGRWKSGGLVTKCKYNSKKEVVGL